MTTHLFNHFRSENEDLNHAFERLSYHLFLRQHSLSEGVPADFNQVGLETYPVLVDGKHIGFQSKYFEYEVDYIQIKTSLNKAFAKYKGKLDEVIVYLNLEKKLDNQEFKNLNKIAKSNKVTLTWITPSEFEGMLHTPQNRDLYQMFFDDADNWGFIDQNNDLEKSNFINSRQYVKQSLKYLDGEVVSDVGKVILESKFKSHLISGSPAAGKSTILYELFQYFAGTSEKTTDEQYKLLLKNGFLPQRIDMKNCENTKLESIIRDRQNDAKVRNKSFKFLYLLDGLDELSSTQADALIFDVYELERHPSTAKIVLSCRSGDFNLIRCKERINNIQEYKIEPLSIAQVEKYFVDKDDDYKIECLSKLSEEQENILNEIKDVFTLEIFWENIEYLVASDTEYDLISQRIKHLLSKPGLQKNLKSLNLLDPKEKSVIDLNSQISALMNDQQTLTIERVQLQDLILRHYSSLSPRDINDVVDYLSKSFFNTPTDMQTDMHFSYIHRRYHEYFLSRIICTAFSYDPKIIRRTGVLTNGELLEKYVFKNLQTTYVRELDLSGLLMLGLITEYYESSDGRPGSWPIYLEAVDFFPALFSQSDQVFNYLMDSQNLSLRPKLTTNNNEIQSAIKRLRKTQYYKDRQLLGNLVYQSFQVMKECIVHAWQYGKTYFAKELITEYLQIRTYLESDEWQTLRENNHIQNDRVDNHDNIYTTIYIRIIILKEDPHELLSKLLSQTMEFEVKWKVDSSIIKTIKTMIRILIANDVEHGVTLIKTLPNGQIDIVIQDLLFSYDLHIFIDKNAFSDFVRNYINQRPTSIEEPELWFCLLKYTLNIELNEFERRIVQNHEQHLITLENENNLISISDNEVLLTASCVDRNKLLNTAQKELYESADAIEINRSPRNIKLLLFESLLQLKDKKITIDEICTAYVMFTGPLQYVPYKNYGYEIAEIWALIFLESEEKPEIKRRVKQMVFNNTYPLSLNRFATVLLSNNKNLYMQIIGLIDLEIIASELNKELDGIYDFARRDFELSWLYAGLDLPRALTYFVDGISEGIARQGWRKDPIITWELVNALRYILEENLIDHETAKTFALQIANLIKKAIEISDGDSTSHGPENLISALCAFDITLAEFIRDYMSDTLELTHYETEMNVPIISEYARSGTSIYVINAMIDELVDRDKKWLAEEKWGIYVAFASSFLHSRTERRIAFDEAYKIVNELREAKSYVRLLDEYLTKEKKEYIKLCEEFEKDENLPPHEYVEIDDTNTSIESSFVDELTIASNKSQLNGLYRRLQNHNNKINLTTPNSWKILIDKTIEIDKDLSRLWRYFSSSHYPNSTYFTSNTHCMYFAWVVLLPNKTYYPEIIKFLAGQSGREAFVEFIRAYAYLGFRKESTELLKYFIVTCDFLVN